MTFLEKLNAIERIDQLIRLKATGSPQDLAHRLSISRRGLFNILNLMKIMGAPIKYCTTQRNYYYEYPCKLSIGFLNIHQQNF